MTSPDVQPYTDLELYDTTPGDLVDRALLLAQTRFPDWRPEAGNTEMVLLEALAVIASELGYAINRVPSSVLEGLLLIYGVERSLGIAPTVQVAFSLTAPIGYTLPAGTVVRLPLGGELEPVDFATDAAVSLIAGTTVTAAATATRPTDEANGTPTGTPVEIVSPNPQIDSAQLATAVTGGAGQEDDVTYRNRGVQRLRRLVSTLVLPEHFTADALETSGVFRALTVDNTNVNVTAAGHVTVAVLGQAGVLVPTATKDALQALLDSKAQANLAVHVVDPTITVVPVTTEVKALSGYDSATVVANVTAALDTYLSPDTWAWAGTVRRNELIAVIDRAEGVDYVVTLTAPAADVALAGVAPLADLGATTVTVT